MWNSSGKAVCLCLSWAIKVWLVREEQVVRNWFWMEREAVVIVVREMGLRRIVWLIVVVVRIVGGVLMDSGRDNRCIFLFWQGSYMRGRYSGFGDTLPRCCGCDGVICLLERVWMVRSWFGT
jgi:hypothetical protein